MKWYWILAIIIGLILTIWVITKLFAVKTCNPACGIHQICSVGKCISPPPGDPDFDLMTRNPGMNNFSINNLINSFRPTQTITPAP